MDTALKSQNKITPYQHKCETKQNKTNGQSEESGVLWKKKKRFCCRRGGYTCGDEMKQAKRGNAAESLDFSSFYFCLRPPEQSLVIYIVVSYYFFFPSFVFVFGPVK